MRKFEYFCMLVVFVMAGISAVMCYSPNVSTWIWQVLTMTWVSHTFFYRKRLDDYEQ